MELNLVDLAPLGLNLLVAAITAAVTVPITAVLKNRIDWGRDQRAWRHRERYGAAVGVLAAARQHEVLTAEWHRLRGKKDGFSLRVQELSGRAEDDFELSEARRRQGVAQSKLAKVNDLILDSVVGVDDSAVRLDILDHANLAALGAAIADAQTKLDQDRADGLPLEDAKNAVKQATQEFVAEARKQLRSGKSAK